MINVVLVMIGSLKVLYISIITNITKNIIEINDAVYSCGRPWALPLNFLIQEKNTSNDINLKQRGKWGQNWLKRFHL